MLMKPNNLKAKTAVHGCHCPGDRLCACARCWPDCGLMICSVTSLQSFCFIDLHILTFIHNDKKESKVKENFNKLLAVLCPFGLSSTFLRSFQDSRLSLFVMSTNNFSLLVTHDTRRTFSVLWGQIYCISCQISLS